jgi:hypothetical protein
VIQFDFHEPVLLPKRTHDRIRRYQLAVKLAIKLRTYTAPFLLRIEPHYFLSEFESRSRNVSRSVRVLLRSASRPARRARSLKLAHLLDPPFDALWIGEELPERKDSNTAAPAGSTLSEVRFLERLNKSMVREWDASRWLCDKGSMNLE